MNSVNDPGFAQYKSTIAVGMSQFLAGNQAKLASMVADLNDLIYVANYMVEEGNLFEPPNAALSGFPTLYARVCHGLWGALGCVQTGALAETASTLRNLFEADISVQFILASPSDRSQLFGEFQTSQSYYNLKGIEEVEQAMGTQVQYGPSDEERFRVKANWNTVKHHFPERPVCQWWWWEFAKQQSDGGVNALAGKQQVSCSLKRVCKELDTSRSDYKYTERYARFYSTFSIAVHPSARQVRAMLGPTGNPTLGPSFNATLAQVVGLLGHLAAGTLDDIIGAFKHPSAPWAHVQLDAIAGRFVSDAKSIVFH